MRILENPARLVGGRARGNHIHTEPCARVFCLINLYPVEALDLSERAVVLYK